MTTTLIDRARAAYAADQDARQRAYDRETVDLVARLREDILTACAIILGARRADVLVAVEPEDNARIFRGTAIVDGMRFRLDRHHRTIPLGDQVVLYACLPCVGCGGEFTYPVRSLRDLGRVLDDQRCADCGGQIGARR